jgi:hypothetical protein
VIFASAAAFGGELRITMAECDREGDGEDRSGKIATPPAMRRPFVCDE